MAETLKLKVGVKKLLFLDEAVLRNPATRLVVATLPRRWGPVSSATQTVSHTVTTGNVRDSGVPANTVDKGHIFTSSSEPIMGSCGKRDDVLCSVEISTSFEPM